MSLDNRLIALAQAMGADVKALTLAQGQLSALNTTTNTSLVAAINELLTLVSGTGAVIDDNAGAGDTGVAWSASKIVSAIAAAQMAVKNDLVNGAGAALDTLSELAAALGNDPSFAANIATQIANRVRFDAAQALSTQQQAQARDNIGAAAASVLNALNAGLGAYDRDYAADYAAAKV